MLNDGRQSIILLIKLKVLQEARLNKPGHVAFKKRLFNWGRDNLGICNHRTRMTELQKKGKSKCIQVKQAHKQSMILDILLSIPL